MSIKPKILRDLKSAKVHFWSKFWNLILDRWWMMAWTSSKYGDFSLWSKIWPWSSRSITPQNNRDLNQGVLLYWSKFGDSSLNGWQVIARTSKWLPHTQTDAGNDNTRRPKLASGKNGVNFDSQVQFDLEDHPSITPRNNRDLNQGLLHLWSKFGDPSLNGWWIIPRTSSWLTDRHTYTHTQAIPEGQNWPRVKIRC